MVVCTFKDRQLVVDDFGEGTPVVFIHPPGMGRKTFYNQRSLSEKLRIILPDLGGHGDSTNLAEKEEISEFVEELVTILDELQISKCVLVGYSAGGIIGLEFSYRYPERVQSLVLIGGYPKVDALKLKVMHLAGMKMVQKQPERLRRLLARVHATDQPMQEELYEHFEKSNTKIWYHFYKQSLYYNCVEHLQQLEVPLLLIYGKSSDWINGHVNLFNDVKKKEVIYIPKANHEIPTKHFSEFNHILLEYIQR